MAEGWRQLPTTPPSQSQPTSIETVARTRLPKAGCWPSVSQPSAHLPPFSQIHVARARSRSPIKSSGCSIPTLRRISPSVTPLAARASAETKLCVVLAGWQARLSTSPRDTAWVNSARRLSTCAAAGNFLLLKPVGKLQPLVFNLEGLFVGLLRV